MTRPTVIRAAHYGETEKRLESDPIVVQMATDLVVGIVGGQVTLDRFTDSGDGPTHEFMLMANRTYRDQGGTDGGHLGAVPTATLTVVREALARLEAAFPKEK